MYVNLTKTSEVISVKQVPHDKKCLGFSASMAMGTSIEKFEKFLATIAPEYKNISVSPPWGFLEAKLYCLKFNKNLSITHGNPKGQKGPAIIVVHSEHYKDVLHAIYIDKDQKIHDPNPDTNDGRDPSTYKIVEWYNIIPFIND
jgi:hypothetical protein